MSENVCLRCKTTLKDCICKPELPICDRCGGKIDPLYGCQCDYYDRYETYDEFDYDEGDDEGRLFIGAEL